MLCNKSCVIGHSDKYAQNQYPLRIINKATIHHLPLNILSFSSNFCCYWISCANFWSKSFSLSIYTLSYIIIIVFKSFLLYCTLILYLYIAGCHYYLKMFLFIEPNFSVTKIQFHNPPFLSSSHLILFLIYIKMQLTKHPKYKTN